MSLRAVAARLGCTPMALYTYVADRRELLDLMYDAAHAALPEPAAGDDWRTRTAAWADDILDRYLRHPWIVEVSFARSVLGPHEQRALELLLDALAPAGLDDSDAAAVVAALFGLARSTASTIADARRSAAVSDERAWWAARTAALTDVAPDFARRFPRSVALAGGAPASAEGEVVADWAHAPGDPPWLEHSTRAAFARAVAMLLDGATASTGRGADLARRDGLARPQTAGRCHPVRDPEARRLDVAAGHVELEDTQHRLVREPSQEVLLTAERVEVVVLRRVARDTQPLLAGGLPLPSRRVHRTTWTSSAASRASSQPKSTSVPRTWSWYARAERWKRSMIQE